MHIKTEIKTDNHLVFAIFVEATTTDWCLGHYLKEALSISVSTDDIRLNLIVNRNQMLSSSFSSDGVSVSSMYICIGFMTVSEHMTSTPDVIHHNMQHNMLYLYIIGLGL